MYPAHTQLVAKCSSPSIGDQRATGCAKGTADPGIDCLNQINNSKNHATSPPPPLTRSQIDLLNLLASGAPSTLVRGRLSDEQRAMSRPISW